MGSPNLRDHTRTVERLARADTEAFTLLGDCEIDDAVVGLVARDAHGRNLDHPCDFGGDERKEIVRLGHFRDERRDPP